MKIWGERWYAGWILGGLGLMLLGQLLGGLEHREPETVTAELYTGDEPVYVQGVVIRQEQPLYSEMSGSYVPAVEDCERVAAGETVLVWQRPSGRQDAARQVRLLQEGLAAGELPLETRRQQIRGSVAALARLKPRDRRQAAETLTGLLMGERPLASETLETARQRLQEEMIPPVDSLEAPAAGVFVSSADGLEQVLTPENPWAPIPLPETPAEPLLAGRLITGDTWYFRGEIPLPLAPGETVRALIPGDGSPVDMTVEALRNGETLLSCRRDLEKIATVRKITIKIVPESKIALEIPAEALYTVGEEAGVWCLVGEAARFKPVTVLENLGGTLLVELDQSTTDTLWPGDRLLLDYD